MILFTDYVLNVLFTETDGFLMLKCRIHGINIVIQQLLLISVGNNLITGYVILYLLIVNIILVFCYVGNLISPQPTTILRQMILLTLAVTNNITFLCGNVLFQPV